MSYWKEYSQLITNLAVELKKLDDDEMNEMGFVIQEHIGCLSGVFMKALDEMQQKYERLLYVAIAFQTDMTTETWCEIKTGFLKEYNKDKDKRKKDEEWLRKQINDIRSRGNE